MKKTIKINQNKIRVAAALEKGLNVTISDIRKISSQDDCKFYVATDAGLLVAEITGAKSMNYSHAIHNNTGTLKLGSAKVQPSTIKIPSVVKVIDKAELLEKPARFVAADTMKVWAEAVEKVTQGGSKSTTYGAAVAVYFQLLNNKN